MDRFIKTNYFVFIIFLLFISCKDKYDLIITGGNIIDGSGTPSFIGDIGIKDGQILTIGNLSSFQSERVIDATGLLITPGFIDVHSHAGRGLVHSDRSDAKALLTQGITTVIINPDGGGSPNLTKQDSALMHDGLGVNVIQMVPHGSIRREVMGMEARTATDDEIEMMKSLVNREMEKGAFGLSSGPFYTPGSYSDTRELVEIAKVIKPYNGIYTSHIRDESNYTIGLEAAVDEVITVAREAEITGIVTHIKALGPPVWGMSKTIIDNIEKARKSGVKVYADQYPYNASATGLGAALLPRWSQGGGHEEFFRRISHPDTLEMIKSEMEANLERRGGPGRIQFRYFTPDTTVQGKTLMQVAQEWNIGPISAALRMLKPGKGVGIVSFNMSDNDVHNFMKQEWTMTCSDGSYPMWGNGVPHPRSFGSFPRKIKKYVLDDKVIPLPQAIKSMTGLSAEIFGIKDRGFLKEGMVADIIIFDLEKIADKSIFTDPFQYSEGINYSLVNGQLAIDNEIFQGLKAGIIIKKQKQ